MSNIIQIAKRRGYRDPDETGDPRSKLHKLVPDLRQIEGGWLIGDRMIPEQSTSHSFNVLADDLRRVGGYEWMKALAEDRGAR